MVLCGPDANSKNDSDFAITFSLGHPIENLAFPRSQAEAAQRSEIPLRHCLLLDVGSEKNLVVSVGKGDLSSEQRQQFQLVIGEFTPAAATESDTTKVSFIFQRH